MMEGWKKAKEQADSRAVKKIKADAQVEENAEGEATPNTELVPEARATLNGEGEAREQ